eukprot:Platyproteum_vivax@DN1379_c0_g1_i1.p1
MPQPESAQNEELYGECVKLYKNHLALSLELKHFLVEKETLYERMQKLEEISREKGLNFHKKRGKSALDVDRPFRCPVMECNKGYGTEATLLQHIRRKHPSEADTMNPPTTRKTKVEESDLHSATSKTHSQEENGPGSAKRLKEDPLLSP